MLFEIGDIGLAIGACALEADVEPGVAVLISFFDHLVEMAELQKIADPAVADFHGRDMQIGCFAFQVLGVWLSAYGCIQGWTTVATTDGDGNAHGLTEGFKDVLTQGFEVGDLLFIGDV